MLCLSGLVVGVGKRTVCARPEQLAGAWRPTLQYNCGIVDTVSTVRQHGTVLGFGHSAVGGGCCPLEGGGSRHAVPILFISNVADSRQWGHLLHVAGSSPVRIDYDEFSGENVGTFEGYDEHLRDNHVKA